MFQKNWFFFLQDKTALECRIGQDFRAVPPLLVWKKTAEGEGGHTAKPLDSLVDFALAKDPPFIVNLAWTLIIPFKNPDFQHPYYIRKCSLINGLRDTCSMMLTYIFTYRKKNLVASNITATSLRWQIQYDWPYLCLVSCLCPLHTYDVHTLVMICYVFCLRLEVHLDFETCWNSLVCQSSFSNKIQNMNTLKISRNYWTLSTFMYHISRLHASENYNGQQKC